jgi:poly(A) polymerase
VPTGIAHGTVTAVVDGHPYEVTTLRHDVETFGRHARVAFTDDWQADAARRDFTMNAMSCRPDGAVFDPFGGADDLRAGRVRFVGDARLRIAEDVLRLLRFFRFFAWYGSPPPDAEGRPAGFWNRSGPKSCVWAAPGFTTNMQTSRLNKPMAVRRRMSSPL